MGCIIVWLVTDPHCLWAKYSILFDALDEFYEKPTTLQATTTGASASNNKNNNQKNNSNNNTTTPSPADISYIIGQY